MSDPADVDPAFPVAECPEVDQAVAARDGSKSKFARVCEMGVQPIGGPEAGKVLTQMLRRLVEAGMIRFTGPVTFVEQTGVLYRGAPGEVLAMVESVPPYEAKGSPHKVLVKMMALAIAKSAAALAKYGGSWDPQTPEAARSMIGPFPGQNLQAPAGNGLCRSYTGKEFLLRTGVVWEDGSKKNWGNSLHWETQKELVSLQEKLARKDVTDQVLQDAIELRQVRGVMES